MPRYRKRQPRLKRRMRRAVLNTTSVKKQDTIPPFSAGSDPQATPTLGSLILTPNPNFFSANPTLGAPNIMLWTPFGKLLGTQGPNATHLRTASEIYARGISERITLDFNDGTAWRWRRIAFTLKGGILRDGFPTTFYETVVQGSTRLQRNLSAAATGSGTAFLQYAAIRNLLFRGGITTDWITIIDAPVDTSRISLIADTTRTLMSGNASSRIIKRKVWTPLNKTIVYDDKESGIDQTSSRWSTTGKAGMGDVYILDMFATSGYADTNARMNFNPTTTLYWHEK